MHCVLKLWADNQPGVLDRIAGLIRRNGYNVSEINAAPMGDGITEIHLALAGQILSVQLLGSNLSELDGVRKWRACTEEEYILREYLLFYLPASLELPPEARGIGCEDGQQLCEYSGSPREIDGLLDQWGHRMVRYVRSGVVTLELMKGDGEDA